MTEARLREWDMASKDNQGFHEAADIFPAMTDEEFEVFKKDIAENGLHTPIVTLPDGRIIDGRHRWRACMETHTEPRYQVYTGNPWAYVISANLHRRHLTASQRAMVGARIALRQRGQHGPTGNDPKEAFHPDHDQLPPTQTDAARMLGIGHTSVQRARRVMHEGIPALATVVDQGLVKVETAARIAAMDEAVQQEFVTRVQTGEKARNIAPVGKHATGGAGVKVSKHPSVSVFTKLNADSLSSGLFGIEMAFSEVTKIDGAVEPVIAKKLITQIRTTKTVLNRLSKLLQEMAEEDT